MGWRWNFPKKYLYDIFMVMQYYSLPSLFIISNTALQLQHTFTNIPDVEIMYKIKKYLPMEARLQIYIIALSSHIYHKLLLVSLQDTLSSRAYRCDWPRTRARSKVYYYIAYNLSGCVKISKTTTTRTSVSGFSNIYFYTLFFPTIVFTQFLTPVDILVKHRGLIILLPIHT